MCLFVGEDSYALQLSTEDVKQVLNVYFKIFAFSHM